MAQLVSRGGLKLHRSQGYELTFTGQQAVANWLRWRWLRNYYG